MLIALFLLAAGPAHADNHDLPDDDRSTRGTCAEFPELCGAGVVWGPDYAGVDNCTADPNCLTRRIVHRGSGASDFIAVPDASDPDATDPDDPDGPAPANPAGPRCTPRAAGRVAPDLAQTALPTGDIGVNPHFEQLTGLESWLWWQGQHTTTWDSPVAVGINADCSTVPAPTAEPYHATLVTLQWHIDDGRPATYTSDHHGSEDHPAVRHTWQTKGRWTVTVTCTWQGHWGQTTTTDCGHRDLDVIEMRARLGN
jgi:hypothetical protein